MKIGILTTHPIQYQVPWFRRLAASSGIDLTVFFAMLPNARQQGDGFGVAFEWDVPLLSGYRHALLENVAAIPSVTTFFGCDTPGVTRIVRDGGFDAFVVNGWVAKSCLQLLRACNRYGVPCIVRGESNDLRPRAWWKRLLHRILLRRYSAFLYIGEANLRFYRKNGVPEDRLFFAPYCVENERFAAMASRFRPERDAIRAKWGIPGDATVYLFCAKFIGKKRPFDALGALDIALRLGAAGERPLHLLMVGSGELLDACRAFATERKLPVTFAGFLNQGEIGRAYAAADCLVLPSDDGETWGLVVNEAMASGIPSIVSDRVGCGEDLVVAGETGERFPLDDVDALAGILLRFAGAPEWLRSMGDSSRRHISAYSYDAVVDGTLRALSAVVAGRDQEGAR